MFATHVVGKGDTLTSISRHFYGTAQRWHEVYDAKQSDLGGPKSPKSRFGARNPVTDKEQGTKGT